MTNQPATLLAPLGAAEPCGPDLGGTLDFAELLRLARGKPAQYVGDQLLVPAEEPAWAAVVELATALLARGKDLRVAVLRARALAATGGWAGLASGLGLVRDLLAGYWDQVHPQLDHEDGGDPTLRLNSLAELASDDLLAALRQLPLVSAPRAGRLSLRQLGAGLPALLQAALGEVDPAVTRATAHAIEDAWQATIAIEQLLEEKLGARAITLGRLRALLADAAALLASPAPALVAAPTATGPVALASPVASPVASSLAGPVGSRADVVRALQAICGFYRAHEPSSPIPLLLERARGLVDKSFLEIVEDLTPDGLGQLNLLRGPQAKPNHQSE